MLRLSWILLSLPLLAAGESPPTWPIPVAPVWPFRWSSINYTGNFPLGPAPYTNVSVVGTWYYDFAQNRWRQDTCVSMQPGAEPACKIYFWNGNDHKAGSTTVGTTYTWKNGAQGKCTYSPSMVRSSSLFAGKCLVRAATLSFSLTLSSADACFPSRDHSGSRHYAPGQLCDGRLRRSYSIGRRYLGR